MTTLVSRARRALSARTRGLSERIEELGHRYQTLLNRAEHVRRASADLSESAQAAFDHAWEDFQACRTTVESGLERLERETPG